MSTVNRCRLTALWLLVCCLFMLGPVPAGAAALFERSLKKLEIKLKDGAVAHEFNFVVMGDSRDNHGVFTRILKATAAYKPLFILHTGGVASDDTAAEYDHFLELLQQNVPAEPIFVVVGNHDIRKQEGNLFRKKIAPLDYVLDLEGAGIKVVALNNATYQLTSQQLQSLDKELSPGRMLNFVVMHIPPKIPRWNRGQCFTQGAGELGRLLTERKATMAFFGHEHVYDADVVGGVKYIITGGAGAPLRRTGFGELSYHFVVVSVKNGVATAEVVRLPR